MSAIVRRIALVADTMTPITKPGASNYQQLSILNGTGGVLYVYSGDTPEADVDNYVKIANGAERMIRFASRQSTDIIVYLKSVAGGDVCFVWG